MTDSENEHTGPSVRLDDLVAILRRVAFEADDVAEPIGQFLTLYWQADERGEVQADDKLWDTLGDLAADLEYYEPRLEWRTEECLFGEGEAVRRVREAMRNLSLDRGG